MIEKEKTPSPIAESLRKRIREIRGARHLTQEQLCDLAGISRDAISRIENGSRMPSIPTLERIIEVFGISWAELFERDARGAAGDSRHVSRIVAMLKDEPVERQQAAEAMVQAYLSMDRTQWREAADLPGIDRVVQKPAGYSKKRP